MKSKEEVEAIFEQVKHLIDSDEPIEHPWEIQPHEFTESERANLLEALPETSDDTAIGEFIRRVGLAIGTYYRLDRSDDKKLSNSEARKKLRALRNSVTETYDRFAVLPVQLHGEVDLALQHVLQSKQIEQGGEPGPYVRSYTTPYSDVTANWIKTLLIQLDELSNALELIEERKRLLAGGKPVDRAMSHLSLRIATAYNECFGHEPTPTEGKPFERILSSAAEIVGKGADATDLNVMHYVRKAIKEMKLVR